jgi:hypothetical protein
MHRYILEPYKSPSSRHRCPGCNKPHKFSLYIDVETSDPIGDRVGRCDREIECGYHYTPKQYFRDNGIESDHVPYVSPVPKPQPPTSYIDPQIFKKSLAAYDSNNLVKFFRTIFDENTVNRLLRKYFIGTSSHWPGATVFWQVDHESRIRTGKVMLYNPETGKRVKEPFSHLTWSHKVLKLENFNHKLCLFGEHLLKADPAKPVAIVESEKTAMISSVYMPQYIWLAVGGLSQLTADRCSVLKGRSVMLYPDLNAYEKWKVKGDEFGFKTSSVLEGRATEEEKKQGLDIADYLLRVNLSGMKPEPDDLSDLYRKTNAEPVNVAEYAPTGLNAEAAVNVQAQVYELRSYFDVLETAGEIVDEAVTLPFGYLPNLRLYVWQVWQDLMNNYHTPELRYYVNRLQLIRGFYEQRLNNVKVNSEQHLVSFQGTRSA